MFDYQHPDEPIESVKKQFEINFFNTMVDEITQDIGWRFNALNEFCDKFGFIYDINYLKSLSKEELRQHCDDLGNVLRIGENSDIEANDLYEELQLIKSILPDPITDGKQFMQYIIQNSFQEIYPNCFIALRIMLTITVSTASAERSFSKLKLVKNYLRNAMGQERLSGLAVLSIEAEIAANLNYEEVLKTFSAMKSRKVNFFLRKKHQYNFNITRYIYI